MNSKHWIVDGMLSGTGIRDGINGGYIHHHEIGISSELSSRIFNWLEQYENAHFYQFEDIANNALLDAEGLEIARALKLECPNSNVTYFSSAYLKNICI